LTALLLAAGGCVVLGRRALAIAPLFLVGPLAQMAFNTWASGSPLGFRHASELTHDFGRGAELFLGLHFDQSQGMFLQQPLLLFRIVAFPLFMRRRPALAAWWALVYASLILPNALELTRYGGDGPDGRFGWSAAWLWAVPLGFAIAGRQRSLAPWVKRAAIV